MPSIEGETDGNGNGNRDREGDGVDGMTSGNSIDST